MLGEIGDSHSSHYKLRCEGM